MLFGNCKKQKHFSDSFFNGNIMIYNCGNVMVEVYILPSFHFHLLQLFVSPMFNVPFFIKGLQFYAIFPLRFYYDKAISWLSDHIKRCSVYLINEWYHKICHHDSLWQCIVFYRRKHSAIYEPWSILLL